MSIHGQVSQELTELLAAYGEPPRMPTYKGDSTEYLLAVNVFKHLSATPEAVARRAAFEQYFRRAHESPAGELPGQQGLE